MIKTNKKILYLWNSSLYMNILQCILMLMLFSPLIININAQSDYQIVQNFKERVSKIEQQIADADSLAVLDQINSGIDQLNSDFTGNQQLIDKSIYPATLAGTVERLKSSVELRKGDFTQITELSTEMKTLKTHIDTLTRHNDELSKRFQELESKNKEDVARLEKTINELRIALQKRDQMVMNMIDSLLPSSFRTGDELTQLEKQQVLSKAEKDNILFHIKRAVSDNIRFLEDTRLHPSDLNKIKFQQEKFHKIWKSVGPTMVELYSGKRKAISEMKDIEEAFTVWDNKINQEVWESLKDEFAANNINLRNFHNGKEFVTTIRGYIDDAKQSAQRMDKDRAQLEYKIFADSTWDEKIKPRWIPFLKDNNLFTEDQEDSVEVLLASWKDTVSPDGIRWWYIVLALAVIGLLVYLFMRKSPEKPAPREA